MFGFPDKYVELFNKFPSASHIDRYFDPDQNYFPMTENEISSKLIGIAIEVHRRLGPGLLESVYRECLAYELMINNLSVEKEKPMPLIYKDIRLDHGYRIDLLVENKVVIEIKTVETLTDVHFAQVLTYLRLGNFRLGLLLNFHEALLTTGLKRIVNKL